MIIKLNSISISISNNNLLSFKNIHFKKRRKRKRKEKRREMSQEADDDCVCKDMDEYMGKSLRFCAVKCLSDGQIQNVTQSALSIIQDLLIQCKLL